MPAKLTAHRYLAIDRASEIKHELVEGEIYAMAGGSTNHARLSSRIGRLVGPQLEGGECDTYSSDLRVRVNHNTYAYPDHTVVCGEVETAPEDDDTAINPTVVFEVLSPSTENYDRGRKVMLYTRIPSLQGVVLVAQDEPLVETFSRTDDGWVWRRFEGLDSVAEIPGTRAMLALRALYSGVLPA